MTGKDVRGCGLWWDDGWVLCRVRERRREKEVECERGSMRQGSKDGGEMESVNEETRSG